LAADRDAALHFDVGGLAVCGHWPAIRLTTNPDLVECWCCAAWIVESESTR
jgi:hypothetical protein